MENSELDQVQTDVADVTSNEDEGLFDDSIANLEETKTPVEEVPEKEEQPTVQEKPFSLHVKYNGEEKDLNEDDARMLAQKGMNYDRFYEPLAKLAKLNGMEVGEYINRLNDTQTQFEVGKAFDELKAKYPDASEELLQELASKRVAENQNLQLKKMEEEIKGNEDALHAEAKRQADVFHREYPDLKPDELDDGVYEYVKQGYSLLEAYNKWVKVEEAKNKPAEDAKKLNEENKKKSFGNMNNAGGEEPDDFFAGFNSI